MRTHVALAGALLLAAQGATALDIGQTAGPVPLATLEGHVFDMNNYGERPGTVVVFLSARCVTTEEQIQRINRLHLKYRLRDVLFVGVCSNPAESGGELREFAQRKGCIFPIYRDPEAIVAKQFGATVTPEFFLLDKAGRLVYKGGLGPEDAPGALDDAIGLMIKRRPTKSTGAPAEGTPIDAPGPRRTIEDPYGMPLFESETLFAKAPGAVAHHCSTLTDAANGDLVCVWYGGSYESAEDQVLFLARRLKGSRQWTPPEVVVSNPGQPPGNAVVFRDGIDRLWIVWGRMESERPIRRGAGWGECRLMYRISEDHGMTWSADRELEDTYGSLPRNAPVTLSDGTLCLPLTGRPGGRHGSYLLMTNDHGATWRPGALIPGASQPTLIERDDGSLFVMMRHRPNIMQSISGDRGATWSPPHKSELRNPDAGIAMRRLANGHVVMVFNNSTVARSPLSIARSTDQGETWEKALDIESNPGEYSYPCVIQTPDGLIHVTYTFRRYTIKHAAFNEDWLTDFERPN